MGDDDSVSCVQLIKFYFGSFLHWFILFYLFICQCFFTEFSLPWPFPSDGGVSCVRWAQSYTWSRSWSSARARARARAWCWRVDDEQWGVLLLWSEGLCAGAHQCWGQVLPPELLHLPSVQHHTQTGRIHLWPDYRWVLTVRAPALWKKSSQTPIQNSNCEGFPGICSCSVWDPVLCYPFFSSLLFANPAVLDWSTWCWIVEHKAFVFLVSMAVAPVVEHILSKPE